MRIDPLPFDELRKTMTEVLEQLSKGPVLGDGGYVVVLKEQGVPMEKYTPQRKINFNHKGYLIFRNSTPVLVYTPNRKGSTGDVVVESKRYGLTTKDKKMRKGRLELNDMRYYLQGKPFELSSDLILTFQYEYGERYKKPKDMVVDLDYLWLREISPVVGPENFVFERPIRRKR